MTFCKMFFTPCLMFRQYPITLFMLESVAVTIVLIIAPAVFDFGVSLRKKIDRW